MADLTSLLDRFDKIKLGKAGKRTAAHKPLLMLFALGEMGRGKDSVAFRDLEEKLKRLLGTYGPWTPSEIRPEYPFWRLRNDGLWKVSADGPIRTYGKGGDASARDLREQHARGGYEDCILQVLKADPRHVGVVARRLLDRHFPESLHQGILDDVGLSLDAGPAPSGRRKRDPEFRQKVLMAYEKRCCVCGYDLRLGDRPAGLEAAHIKWHTHGGPDDVSNGLSLCVLHHKAFDLGAFTVQNDGCTIACSQHLSGSTNVDWLIGFHGKSLKKPQSSEYLPRQSCLDWHRDTIFRTPEREL
ncbi:MAG: HNH endonuclease [Boseongicola sp.]|nr:HNH endonuclease [Boseongicola sp.]